jgi:hypothetical protein
MNGRVFLTYVERCLAPTLGRGDIVIMDNLPTHKMAVVTEAIEAADAITIYACVSSGSQPDRTSLQQTQGTVAQGRRTDNSCPVAKNPLDLAYRQQEGMSEFLSPRRLRVDLTGIRSSKRHVKSPCSAKEHRQLGERKQAFRLRCDARAF